MLKILEILQLLRDKVNLPLATILKILAKLSELSLPPDVSEKEQLRVWCKNLVGTLEKIAEITPTAVDDSLIAGLKQFTDSADAWDLAYDLLVFVMDGLYGDKVLAAANPESNAKVQAVEAKVGMSPILIFTIAKLVIDLIVMLRNR